MNGTGLVQQADVAKICDHAEQAATDGFSSYWLAEHPTGGLDALTVLAAVGRQVPGLELGTAIVPTFPSASHGAGGTDPHHRWNSLKRPPDPGYWFVTSSP